MEDEEDLEVLGEQLYDLIYPKHAEIAGKLTGESPHNVLHLHSHSNCKALRSYVGICITTNML